MILADSSVWIEFDRATGSPADRRIAALIRNDGPLAVTEPVVMEIVAGARSAADATRLRRLLARFAMLRFDPVADFDAAASVYRKCRSAGITPGGLLDCMIAAVAWRHGATLLTRDAHLVRMAALLGVELDKASGTA